VNYIVPSEINAGAKIALVGEQPAKYELRNGKPFSGPAGKNLDDCLQAAGIARRDCSLHNTICTVEEDLSEYITLTGSGANRKGFITPKGSPYVEMLKEELTSSSANIIVALGNIPLFALTGRVGITNWRGSIIESTLVTGKKILPTFHPATWTEEKLYKAPEAFLNKYLVIMELKKAKLEAEFPEIRAIERALKIAPTYYEAIQFLSYIDERASFDSLVLDYDIETVPGTSEISCISLSINEKYAMCIPFIYAKGDYFSLEQEASIIRALGKLLENNAIKKRGQNLIFDSHLIFRKYGIVTRNIADTMVAQKILYPDFCGSVDATTGKPKGTSHKGASLQFITAMWTDIPYYKQDGKQFLTGMTDWEKGWRYNCLDSLATSSAFPRQLNELREKGNLKTYERQIQLIEPLTYMMEHGIRVNKEGMEKERKVNEQRITVLEQMCYKLIGMEINLDSPKQLMEYFYNTLKLPPYTKDGKVTVNVDAMKKIASQGHSVAALILELRGLRKRNSTFLNIAKIDADGRVRCSYNPVGTRYGRISSSENIFGTGMNLQNVPHHVLTYFLADPGSLIYELDYSQIENRIVAYCGNIPTMIQVFEKGLDSHRMTAALVLSIIRNKNVAYEEITADERQDYGKRPNHAFNYGYGPNSFAMRYELSITEAKNIHEAYHRAYPGLEKSYWKYVQNCLRENRTLTNLLDRKVIFLGKWGEKLLHEAYSCIPQGTCGDMINERGIIFSYFNSDPLFKHAEILTQIHDSMAIQIPLNIPVKDHATILVALKKSLETPLIFKGKKFIVPVDLVVNNCLNKERGIELKGKNFSDKAEILADQLEAAIKKPRKSGEKVLPSLSEVGINYVHF